MSILAPGTKVAVWFTDEGAKAFLGKDMPEGQNRWLLLGTFHEEQPGFGVWLEVDLIQQWKATSEVKHIAVSPKMCLVRWDAINHMQKLDDAAAKPDITMMN